LRRLGLRTVADVAAAPLGMLRQALGEAAAAHLHELANGRDPRPVSTDRVEKSTGAETTFDVDVSDPDEIRRTLLGLATGVARRLRRSGHAGRTVAIKHRLADFRNLNRTRTQPTATDEAREIFDTAWQLYRALDPGDRIRLIGVRVEGLGPVEAVPRQPTLGERESGWREAERAADAAVARFGGAVGPASLLRTERAKGPRTDPAGAPRTDPAGAPRTDRAKGPRADPDMA
jgi:DNA polymerase-4